MKRSFQSVAALSSTTLIVAGAALFPSLEQHNDNPGGTLSSVGNHSERRAGRILFNSCQSCHVGGPTGPPFWQEKACVMGQMAGTMYVDYPYSPALKTSGVVWDDETLDAFLEDPQSIIPGTVMANQPITDPIERKIIIDTLNSYCSMGSNAGFGPESSDTNGPTVPNDAPPIPASDGTRSSTVFSWTMLQAVGVSCLLLVGADSRRR